MAETRPLLSVHAASVRFGGIAALEEVSIAVSPRTIYGLVGPNGAGKTTLLNAINGVVPLAAGRVELSDNEISRVPLHRRASLGIGRTFQGVELFHDLSVQDNLMIGRHHLMKAGILSAGLFWGSAQREEIAHRQRVEELIEFFEIERYRKVPVGKLGYGTQKIVGLARAMCSEPVILLLDEVASGLNREEKEDLARFMLRIKHVCGTAIVWVEHDVRMVAELVDEVAVLNYGRLVASGPPDAVFADPKVREVFLGIKEKPAEAQPA